MGDYGVRAADAINHLVPGPNRDKAVARIFRCSVRMARYLRSGQFWSIDRLNQASAKVPGFDEHIANPHLARYERIMQEIEDIREQHLKRGKYGQ